MVWPPMSPTQARGTAVDQMLAANIYTIYKEKIVEENLSKLTLTRLFIQMDNFGRARGAVAGWRQAAAYLRSLAGEQFAAENDKYAAELRRVAKTLEVELAEQEANLPIAQESALWGEIDRRQTLEDTKDAQ